MPARLAARSSPPTAWTCRPRRVRVTTIAATMTVASDNRKISGTGPTLVLVKSKKLGLEGGDRARTRR